MPSCGYASRASAAAPDKLMQRAGKASVGGFLPPQVPGAAADKPHAPRLHRGRPAAPSGAGAWWLGAAGTGAASTAAKSGGATTCRPTDVTKGSITTAPAIYCSMSQPVLHRQLCDWRETRIVYPPQTSVGFLSTLAMPLRCFEPICMLRLSITEVTPVVVASRYHNAHLLP